MAAITVMDGPLYQWDTGRRVRVIPDLGENIELVHYSNGSVVETQPDGDNVIAPIPNILLQTPKPITVYAVMTSADGVRTVTDRKIPVNAKPKPDDYVYTETEVMSWQALDARMREFMAHVEATIKQPDLNAPEGAPGHVKGRTHYVETVETDIIPEQTATIDWDREKVNGKEFYGSNDLEWHGRNFEDGEIVALYVDGERYEVPISLTAINTANTRDPDNEDVGVDVPFCLRFYDANGLSVAEGTVIFCGPTPNTTYTVKMCSIGRVVHKLPMKFLPDKIPTEALPDGVPYSEGGVVEIVAAPPTYDESDTMFFGYSTGVPAAGDVCIVTWNGMKYSCVAQDASALLPGAVLLGDGTNMGMSGNSEPFMIAIGEQNGENIISVLPLDGTTELTLSILCNHETIRKLDEKLLPESVDSIIIRSSTADSTKKFKLTVDDSGTITATEVT